MPQSPILVPTRLRRPPQTGWSWVDRRFLRDHAAHIYARRRALVFRPLPPWPTSMGCRSMATAQCLPWCGSTFRVDGRSRRTYWLVI